ncbi:MAG TPA: PD-(D/E)XK nuclease domain-containing protein, partial [Myxococcota bacterium]|nr:PD-(D/E)XK nuclease domain-containing protein [Myxococcota bacterium]
FSLLAKSEELFGFTEAEVAALLPIYGRQADADEIRAWYNGYRFGERTVYNPWSVLSALDSPEEEIGPHWLNTSDNAMVRELLLRSGDLHAEIKTLLEGGSIERRIEENVVVRELRGSTVWSFLLFSGYLAATGVRLQDSQTFATLCIPNREVAGLWRGTFRQWMEEEDGAPATPLQQAILAGSAEKIQEILSKMLLRHVSYHDVAEGQDEAFYHAFVLGLLVSMEPTHTVRSNRQVGRGRADVQIIPKQPGRPGAVLEFKKQNDKRSLFAHAGQALRQIQQQGYCAELEAAGAAPIRRLGIAFSGKQVVVRG